MRADAGTTSRTRYLTLAALGAGAGNGVLIGVVLTSVNAAYAVAGVADADEVVRVALAGTRAVFDLAAVVTIGFAVLPVLVGDRRPALARPLLARARQFGVVAALVWTVCALVLLVLQTAEYQAAGGVSLADLGSYVTGVNTGKALGIVAALAFSSVVLGIVAMRNPARIPAEVRVGLGLCALLPLPLTGHAASLGMSGIPLVSMALHVGSAVLWSGGLTAIATLLIGNRTLLAYALPRFSKLATVCLVVTAATGLVNGCVELVTNPRTGLWDGLFTTAYGQLVLAKATCLIGAAALGAYTRWRLLPQIMRHRHAALATWATTEVALMGLAVGLAAVLSRTAVA